MHTHAILTSLPLFLGVLELQMEQYTLYLTRHYATSTHALALFQAGSDLAETPLPIFTGSSL
jgi:hypothetical protein